MKIEIKKILTEDSSLLNYDQYTNNDVNKLDSLYNVQNRNSNHVTNFAEKLHDIRTIPSERAFYNQEETQDEFNTNTAKMLDNQVKVNGIQYDINSNLYNNNLENKHLANNALRMGIGGIGIGAVGAGLGLYNTLKNRNQK